MTNYIENINDNSLSGDVFDGQPSETFSTAVFGDTTFTANQYRTYSLASIIPDDDYDYEVLFEAWANTGTKSGNAVGVILYSGTATSGNDTDNFNTRVIRGVTRTSSNQQYGGCVILPIKASDKKITVRNSEASGTSGNISLNVRGLRRIGTNKKSEDTQYVSHINSNTIGGKLLNGQWVGANHDIATGLSITTGTAKEYDLSEYLPDDNYSYEVMFTVTGRTGTTSGNTATIRVGLSSTASDNPVVFKQVTRASNYMVNGGNCRVVIGSNRKIYIGNTGGSTSTNINFVARAYRRVGTNSTTNTPNICIKSNVQVPNSLIYGNPTVSNGIVSGFNEENYLQLLNGKQDNNAEYVVKFTTGSVTKASSQDIYCAENFFILEIYNNTWNVVTYNWETEANVTLFTASANTTYWVKISVNGKTKTFRYSTDGESYTLVASFTDNNMDITNDYPLRIGNHSANRLLYERAFLGSVDLNETYTNVNNVRFWDGMDYKKYLPIGGDIADGQWTRNNIDVFDQITLSNGTRTYTVNNFLPEDDVPYEIIATSYGRTGSKSGNSATWWINDSLEDVIGDPVMGYVYTRTASSMADAKGAIIICTQRNGVITIPISVTSSATTGNCGLWLTAYRRVGNNI